MVLLLNNLAINLKYDDAWRPNQYYYKIEKQDMRCDMGQYDEFKAQVVDTCRRLVEKGFLIGTGGNVSMRVPGQKALAITPSNYDYLMMLP